MHDDVLGSPVSLPQLLAHLFFLQDLLGYRWVEVPASHLTRHTEAKRLDMKVSVAG